MENKHKFFALGSVLGFVIPFFENLIRYETPDITNLFGYVLIVSGNIWQYIFLYLVAALTFVLYFNKTREKINSESRFVFLVSGAALGFAIISVISATIGFIE